MWAEEVTTKPLLHPTMLVHIGKTFSAEILSWINDVIIAKAFENKTDEHKEDEDDPGDPKASSRGKLLLDATGAPTDITYPTDLKLLNQAR
ncbi:MAG: hypothetical protein JRJ83_02660 [Deltaproteobacteria bacterium]|nr:hypothetical protein [Deltaproteobacteria bacterium]